MEINGKVGLVTGAGHVQGIGYAIAQELLKKGAKGVAVLDIDDTNGQDAIISLKKGFGDQRVLYIHCDVSIKSSLEDAFEQVKKHFGGIDIVCNNAGILNEINWEATVDINLKGVIRGTYLALEHMGILNGGKGGVVVNTASIHGILTNSIAPVYGATKHAIVAFTRNVADEDIFKRNEVRVSAICPAKVDTPIQNKTVLHNMELFNDFKDSFRNTPMAYLTDAVIKLIEDTELNGITCAILPDDSWKIVEPLEIKLI